MRTRSLALAAARLCLLPAVLMVMPLVGGATRAGAQDSGIERDADEGRVDMDTFYDELEGQGRWFRHDRYGEVWQPDIDDEDWRPYTRGRWANTEEHGWTWLSDEPWGWATYHYGRWALDTDLGWIWVPGFEWAPAWVAWRESDDFVGWAPLPPEAVWRSGRGLAFDADFYNSPGFAPYWSFVAPRYLTHSRLQRHMAPPRRNREIFTNTRSATNYAVVDRRVINLGIRPQRLERITGGPVPFSRVLVTPDPRARAVGGSASSTVRVYRPENARGPGGPGGRPDRARAPVERAPATPPPPVAGQGAAPRPWQNDPRPNAQTSPARPDGSPPAGRGYRGPRGGESGNPAAAAPAVVPPAAPPPQAPAQQAAPVAPPAAAPSPPRSFPSRGAPPTPQVQPAPAAQPAPPPAAARPQPQAVTPSAQPQTQPPPQGPRGGQGPRGDRPAGERPAGERPPSERPRGERPAGAGDAPPPR